MPSEKTATQEAFGGNKLRKLEYIVPDAIASNADTLVSIKV
jgi:1-aminocyclopropane-1-carboxylate deaminase